MASVRGSHSCEGASATDTEGLCAAGPSGSNNLPRLRLSCKRQASSRRPRSCALALEEAADQIVPCHVGHAFAQKCEHFGFLGKRHPRPDPLHPTPPITLFRCLRVELTRTRLLLHRRSSRSTALWHDAIHFDQGIIDPAPTIRDGRWGPIRVSTPLECPEDFQARQRFVFGYPTRNSQPAIHVQHRGAPELSAFGCFGIAFFLPCCPRRPRGHPIDNA
jgi:hypothetical protein